MNACRSIWEMKGCLNTYLPCLKVVLAVRLCITACRSCEVGVDIYEVAVSGVTSTGKQAGVVTKTKGSLQYLWCEALRRVRD